MDLRELRVHLRPGDRRPRRRHPARHQVRGHPQGLVLPRLRRRTSRLPAPGARRGVSLLPRKGRGVNYDYDWMVVGSGFGGSVSALRLAEKGYSVAVLECGSRFADEDFAESNLKHPRRYFWLPKLRLPRGHADDLLQGRLHRLRQRRRRRQPRLRQHALPRSPRLLQGPAVGRAGQTGSASSRRTTTRRSGCSAWSSTRASGPADKLLQEYGEEIGVGETFTNTRVGVFFDQPGVEVADPFFDGEGPDRTGCMRCGSCMVGCRHGAKNTLMKNYLWFAEKLGVEIQPERQVTEIRPLGAADGSDGYAVTSERSGSWLRKRPAHANRPRRDRRRRRPRHQQPARQLPPSRRAAADLRPPRRPGPHQLGVDPVGHRRPTTSVTSAARWRSRRASTPTPTPTSRSSPTARRATRCPRTFTAMTGPGTKLTRPIKWLAAILRHPLRTARMLIPHRWSQRTVILLVMQTVDAAMHFRPKRKIFGGGVRLQTRTGPGQTQPDLHPGRRESRALVRQAHRRRRPERRHRVGPQHPLDRPHPRRRGRRRRPRERRRRPAATASSATRTCSSATARRYRPTRA